MALCSYDNELNQKYNYNKELKMTQAVKDLIAQAKATTDYETTTELKDAVAKLELLGDNAKGDTQEYKALKSMIDSMAEAKRLADEENLIDDGDSILVAFELAEKNGKVARKGWSKELKNYFVFIPRGHTLPQLSNGKHASPYTPSIEDVMSKDWYNLEQAGE